MQMTNEDDTYGTRMTILSLGEIPRLTQHIRRMSYGEFYWKFFSGYKIQILGVILRSDRAGEISTATCIANWVIDHIAWRFLD